MTREEIVRRIDELAERIYELEWIDRMNYQEKREWEALLREKWNLQRMLQREEYTK